MTQYRGEAEKIYRALFGLSCPNRLRDLYEICMHRLEPDWAAQEWLQTGRLIESTSHLESTEFAARILKKYPSLSMRFRLVSLLEETSATSVYQCPPGRRLAIVLSLLKLPFQMVIAFTVGFLVLKKYEARL